MVVLAMVIAVVGVASIATVVGRTGPNATCLTIGEGSGCTWYVSGDEPAGFAFNGSSVAARVPTRTTNGCWLRSGRASSFSRSRCSSSDVSGSSGIRARRAAPDDTCDVATVTALVAGLILFPAGVSGFQPDPCAPGQGPRAAVRGARP